MTEASAPTLLDQKIVDAGERIPLHPHPLCSKLFLQTPDLHLSTLNPGEASGGIRISAPGGYSLLQEVREEQQVINFFARVPVEERTTELVTRTEPLVLSADSENQESRTVEARIFAPARLLALLLMGLLLVEWGMYHRERY